MYHRPITAAPALRASLPPPTPVPQAIHPLACRCLGCAAQRDPIAFARARRLLRTQALLLLACAAAFTLIAVVNLPGIAAAFGVGQ